jgi:hypothetical protein
MTGKIPTNNYVDHFDKSKSHHRAFFQALLDRVEELDPKALQEGGELRDLWIAAVETKAPTLSLVPTVGPSGWPQFVSLAQEAGARFPDLVAAQWALESGWGRHTSGVNNYFGLKGAGAKAGTKEFVNGKWITTEANFLDFPTPGESVKYLVDKWYKDYKGYKGVNNAPTKEDAARMLVSEGYATDPDYAAKLIRLMNENASSPSSVKPAIPPLPPPIPMVIKGAVGPKKTPHCFDFKPGDSHVIVNDISETAQAFSFAGTRLWEVPMLARGQGSEIDFRSKGSDTPPGLYKIGDIYKDYEKVGESPQLDRTLMSYGWYSFDLVDLENQERRNGRAGVMIHGGGSACGWPQAWAPMQKLYPTLGCIRMHNQHLRDRLLPLTRMGRVFVSVYQESP